MRVISPASELLYWAMCARYCVEPSEETHAHSLKDCMLERLKVTTIPPKGSLTDGQPFKCYSFDEYGLLVNGESDF